MGRKRGKKKSGRKKNGTATEGGTVPEEQKNTEDMLDSSPQPKVPYISYETLKSGSNIVPDPAAKMYTDFFRIWIRNHVFSSMILMFIFGNRPTLFLVVVNLL